VERRHRRGNHREDLGRCGGALVSVHGIDRRVGHAESRQAGDQRVHRMAASRKALDSGERLGRQGAATAQFSIERGQLVCGRKRAEQQQVGDFLETCVLGEVFDGEASVVQLPFGAVDEADLRPRRRHPCQTGDVVHAH